ncbi:MAG: TraR/DksA family transcriptional regulator [Nitrospirae bacterium]|nr:MAG: TraR/DksA family transcriptional regulator [Nitrospirota bacterium]
MSTKGKVNKKPVNKISKSVKPPAKRSVAKAKSKGAAEARPSDRKRTSATIDIAPKAKSKYAGRRDALHRMLMAKRQEIMNEIGASLGQSLTDDQQRRLESAMDVGDQALMDLERELGISLMEMRNRRRQLIDEALARLDEGTYGLCAECGVDISEKRLVAVPFAKLCVECQSQQELMEKIEKGEERD